MRTNESRAPLSQAARPGFLVGVRLRLYALDVGHLPRERQQSASASGQRGRSARLSPSVAARAARMSRDHTRNRCIACSGRAADELPDAVCEVAGTAPSSSTAGRAHAQHFAKTSAACLRTPTEQTLTLSESASRMTSWSSRRSSSRVTGMARRMQYSCTGLPMDVYTADGLRLRPSSVGLRQVACEERCVGVQQRLYSFCSRTAPVCLDSAPSQRGRADAHRPIAS